MISEKVEVEMIFNYGSDVIKENGEKIGEVKEVVIDPKTEDVTHIVIEKGILLTEDKVLPISLVEDADQERVKLYPLEEPVDDLPKYEEEQFVEVREEEGKEPLVGNPPFLYNYPPVGPYKKGDLEFRTYKKEKIKNIPKDVTPIEKGAKVITLDDQHVGNVEEVIIDPQTDEATHLVVSEGLLLVEEKLVPISWVNDYDEEKIHLAVDRKVIENLPKYHKQEKTPFR